MTLYDYLAVLRRNWLLIAMSTVCGLALGIAASLLTTPVYSATAQMFVSVQSATVDSVGNVYTGGLFVQQRMQSYTPIVGSPGVLEPVIDELDLATTPAALARQVSATSPENSVLIDVQATDTDPEMAAALANATAAALGEEIQRLETTEGGGLPVKASITTPAGTPDSPVTPNTKLNLALGLFLGLGAGVSIALLRRILDTTVKDPVAVTSATGATVLGAIPFDPQAKAKPLITLDHVSVRSEAFRSIRTNLQYVDVDHPPRSVVITSPVSGEGTTTTACNLAITLAQAGSRVLLVETDLRRPRVADYLGIDGSVGLTDVLIGRAQFDSVKVSWDRGLLDVLASGPIPPNPSELLASHQMGQLLGELSARYDTVIFDAPPLLPVTDAAVLAALADGALVVVRHGSTTRDQVVQATKSLHVVNARLLGAIMNFVPAKTGRHGYGHGYGYGYGYGEEPGDAGSTRERLTIEQATQARPAEQPPVAPTAQAPSAEPRRVASDGTPSA